MRGSSSWGNFPFVGENPLVKVKLPLIRVISTCSGEFSLYRVNFPLIGVNSPFTKGFYLYMGIFPLVKVQFPLGKGNFTLPLYWPAFTLELHANMPNNRVKTRENSLFWAFWGPNRPYFTTFNKYSHIFLSI